MTEETKQKMQRKQHRIFTDVFKAGAVRLAIDEGKSVADLARDLP